MLARALMTGTSIFRATETSNVADSGGFELMELAQREDLSTFSESNYKDQIFAWAPNPWGRPGIYRQPL
jgi:hypothetical protein